MKMKHKQRHVTRWLNAVERSPHGMCRSGSKIGASGILMVRTWLLALVTASCLASMAFGTNCPDPARGVETHAEPAILAADYGHWGDVPGWLEAIDDAEFVEGLTTQGHQNALIRAKDVWRDIYQVLADNSQHINEEDGTIAIDVAPTVRAAVHGHLNSLAETHEALLGTPANLERKRAFATLSYLNDNLMSRLPPEVLQTYQPPTAGVATAELAAGHNAVRAGTRWYAMSEAQRADLVPGNGANPAWAVAARWYPGGTVVYGEPGLNLKLHGGKAITDDISKDFYQNYFGTDDYHWVFDDVPNVSIGTRWAIKNGFFFAEWVQYRWEHDSWPLDTHRAPMQQELHDRVAHRTDALNTASQNTNGYPHRYTARGAGMPYLHGEQSAINNVSLNGIAPDGTSPVHLSVHTYGQSRSFNNCASCSSTLDGWALSTTGGGPYGSPSRYTR